MNGHTIRLTVFRLGILILKELELLLHKYYKVLNFMLLVKNMVAGWYGKNLSMLIPKI